MDIGGDKELLYMNFLKEENLFFGWCVICIVMDCREILCDQFCVILCVLVFGKLCIMFLMIIFVEEVCVLCKEIEIYKQELCDEGKVFDELIEIGVMVEILAVVIIVCYLVKEVDFFSIGINDLMQYILVVDCGNDMILYFYQLMLLFVLNLIK